MTGIRSRISERSSQGTVKDPELRTIYKAEAKEYRKAGNPKEGHMGKRDKEIVVVVTNLSKGESREIKDKLIREVRNNAPQSNGAILDVAMDKISDSLKRLGQRG